VEGLAVSAPLLAVTAPDSYQPQGRVTLAWRPSPDASVVGYRVYWGYAPSQYVQSASAGSKTNLTLTGLAEGTRIYFAVTAQDAAGIESVPSNEISITVPAWVGFRFDRCLISAMGLAGKTNEICVSTNLTDWTVLKTFIGQAGVTTNCLYTNTIAASFRLRLKGQP
jgi:hypothetical protein